MYDEVHDLHGTILFEGQTSIKLSTSRSGWLNTSGGVYVRNASAAGQKTTISSDINEVTSGSGFRSLQGGGSYNSSTAVNAVRFMFAAGNITSGRIQMYGRST